MRHTRPPLSTAPGTSCIALFVTSQKKKVTLSMMSKQVVLLRVGIDSGSGGIQGPLFKDGTFDFVCIPDKKQVGVHTYGSMIGKNGQSLVNYFPASKRKRKAGMHIHVDPEFETFTYGDPTTPKRSLQNLRRGDFLVFYCGLQKWDTEKGWDKNHRPALYLAVYFEVALAGRATEFSRKVLRSEFAKNFHVRHPSLFKSQKNDLVLVKGGSGSRLLRKAVQISSDGKDCRGRRLKVLSPKMRKIFGDFGAKNSIQRSPPRWVAPRFVDKAIDYIKGLE